MSLNSREIYLYVEPVWFYHRRNGSIADYISSKITNADRIKRVVIFDGGFVERDNEYFANAEVKRFPYYESIALQLLENDLNVNPYVHFHIYLRDASIAQALRRSFPNAKIEVCE